MCNTTSSRPPSLTSVHKCEKGGLSGEPIKDMATEAIREMYKLTNGKFMGLMSCRRVFMQSW